MDMIGKVRRMKLRDQLSDGEICRRTGLARNTVKKWLKAPGDIPPKYKRKKADGKLTPFVPVLEQALRADAHRAKHARRSGKALFAQIQARDTGVATAQLLPSFVLGARKVSRTPPRLLYH
jgi:transposase